MTYYNEHDPKAVEWLGNLAAAGLLPSGTLDARDIQEVVPDDVRGFRECHFFAGIGGWPLALRLAGWPADEPIWTGSPPCQPYSQAGKGEGDADPRNLWPELRRLIAECHPPVVLGEQVASNAGRDWLARVRADLEALGYAVGAADLCAAGAGEEAEGLLVRGDTGRWERIVLGAPHIRQRLFWVADARRPPLRGEGRRADGGAAAGVQGTDGQRERLRPDAGAGRRRVVFGFDESRDVETLRRQGSWGPREDAAAAVMQHVREPLANRRLAESGSERRGWREGGQGGGESDGSAAGRLEGPHGPLGLHEAPDSRMADSPTSGRGEGRPDEASGWHTDESRRLRDAGPWSAFDLVPCLDGKARRAESGAQCLVDGVPFRLADGRTSKTVSRKALLKGFGNAIVPELAATFIRAFMEATG